MPGTSRSPGFLFSGKVMRRLRHEAVRLGRTMSEMVETALRLLLVLKTPQQSLKPLPRFRGGGTLVNIPDREGLYESMERR